MPMKWKNEGEDSLRRAHRNIQILEKCIQDISHRLWKLEEDFKDTNRGYSDSEEES